MRNITWELQIDPETFVPAVHCLVEGKVTGVYYSMECVTDLTAQYGKDQFIADIKMLLNDQMRDLTDMTLEEREFALEVLTRAA